MNFPIDLSGMTPTGKLNQVETVIEEFCKVSQNHTVVSLPTFKLMPGFKDKLDINSKHIVTVDYDFYENNGLEHRPVYISTDTNDKRPVIMSGNNVFEGGNHKIFLIDLITGSLKNSDVKVIYKDGNIYNLLRKNIDLSSNSEEKEESFSPPTIKPNPVPEPIINIDEKEESFSPAAESNPVPEPIINIEERKAFKEAFNNIGDKIEIDEKTQKMILRLCDNNPSLMIQKILDGEHITLLDAQKDEEFKWLGVYKNANKGDTTYTTKIANLSFGTFDNALDAAKHYNEIIIKYSLPYPVNNIPEVLEICVNKNKDRFTLLNYETWELANEVSRRVKPEKDKFYHK